MNIETSVFGAMGLTLVFALCSLGGAIIWRHRNKSKHGHTHHSH